MLLRALVMALTLSDAGHDGPDQVQQRSRECVRPSRS